MFLGSYMNEIEEGKFVHIVGIDNEDYGVFSKAYLVQNTSLVGLTVIGHKADLEYENCEFVRVRKYEK